jgi:hypothetical protein
MPLESRRGSSRTDIPVCPRSIRTGAVATGFRADFVISELRPGRYRGCVKTPGSQRQRREM